MPKRPIASHNDFDSLDPSDELEPLDDADEQEAAGFERIRRSTAKAANPKLDRRQQSKEWGKAINKYHKERKRFEGRGKP